MQGSDAPDYFTADEYAGGYDGVTVAKPVGAVTWNATLYYQTTSKEYVEFLRDEINGVGTTLPPEAYIAQTDPFFANLKGWGDAIWDLWLHNGGAEPVMMQSIGSKVTPGDINGDGVVNIVDLTIVAVSYGKREGEPGYDPDADLTGDGLVDIRDIVIVAIHYGESDP